ncbi:hypothetical protein CEXT_63711 [Caerostris extrusa]|uniref:Uncharacterized protein n=1 Tax=Caerostris extrusa TaxID=172846 RepID=A0AAV4TYH0_CAEEX|nr:hypothetical protein CEXT_63711 [Caerostris extrusa]
MQRAKSEAMPQRFQKFTVRFNASQRTPAQPKSHFSFSTFSFHLKSHTLLYFNHSTLFFAALGSRIKETVVARWRSSPAQGNRTPGKEEIGTF